MPHTPLPITRLVAPLGVLLGAVTGAALVSLGGATAYSAVERPAPERAPTVEVAHVPPLLTTLPAGAPVELGFDAYCLAPRAEDTEERCDAAGSVFVRAGDRGTFTELPLLRNPVRDEGRLVATVPSELTRSPLGFSYYAVIEDRTTGATTTVPAGGADAPQRSVPLGRPVEVHLRQHRFGAGRPADARVAEAAWGTGRAQVGLEQGRNLAPIGGASFDVLANGTVYVLDEANLRALRWRRGEGQPAAIPLAIDGAIADLAVSESGRLHVLETTGPVGRPGLLRTFTPVGAAASSVPLAERAYRVRIDPDEAPVVLQQTSRQWVRVSSGDGRPASLGEQRASGRSGQPLTGGDEVVVLRHGDELRVAVVGRAGIRRAWRVTSDTPLAEVQLAEPLGSRLVVVARVYTDTRDEFLVLVLGQQGLVRRFSLSSSDWAETAPLSRFRLVGSSLYQLGSNPAGMFVDRYDLEVE